MALREKFGRLVLLDETEAGPLGHEYRAARLGPAGLDRLVTVFRFGAEVSSHGEATKRLMEEARLAARLQNPGLVRVLGIGRVEQAFYVSTELVEGRSVAAVLERCRIEGFPFSADQALMIASRAASALEFLHGRKDEAGLALIHGLVSPLRLVVAFDGEVKLKGLGLWPALRGTDLLPAAERRYLAPEQAAGGAGDARSDVYALGLVVLEALTGLAPDGTDPLDGFPGALITSGTGERAPLPPPVAELLRRALGREPEARFAGMADFRKAIDTLLFSGDFAPTTFDLAFFMHTLFREDMEREARALEEARRGDYREFLAEERPSVTAPAGSEAEVGPAPGLPTAARPRSAEAVTQVSPPMQAEGARPTVPDRPAPAPGSGPDASGSRPAATRGSRETAAREAAARMTLGGTAAAPGGRRGLWLLLGLLGAVAVGGGAGFLYFVKLRGPSAPPAPSAEASAAQARVEELEAKIARLEREKAEAETRAADEARQIVEAQAAAKGRTADPAAVRRAQDEARQRARSEQEQKQQEELRRLADERTAEVQRLAADATPMPPETPAQIPTPAPTPTPTPTAEAAATVTQPLAATPTPTPAAPPTAAGAPTSPPASSPGPPTATRPAGAPATPPPAGRATADPNDPAVKPPVFASEEPVPYPPRAVSRRISTTVVVRALVDEQGRVSEVAIVQPSGLPAELGFDEAALKRVRSRRYRPARRNGVPVAIWVVVRVDFRPPPRQF